MYSEYFSNVFYSNLIIIIITITFSIELLEKRFINVVLKDTTNFRWTKGERKNTAKRYIFFFFNIAFVKYLRTLMKTIRKMKKIFGML